MQFDKETVLIILNKYQGALGDYLLIPEANSCVELASEISKGNFRLEAEAFRQKNVYGKIGNVRLGIDHASIN